MLFEGIETCNLWDALSDVDIYNLLPLSVWFKTQSLSESQVASKDVPMYKRFATMR